MYYGVHKTMCTMNYKILWPTWTCFTYSFIDVFKCTCNYYITRRDQQKEEKRREEETIAYLLPTVNFVFIFFDATITLQNDTERQKTTAKKAKQRDKERDEKTKQQQKKKK